MNYVVFKIKPKAKSRVTETWAVWSNGDGSFLGEVSWFSHWRRYTFCPGNNSVFDANCLWDIADFISKQTRARQIARAKK